MQILHEIPHYKLTVTKLTNDQTSLEKITVSHLADVIECNVQKSRRWRSMCQDISQKMCAKTEESDFIVAAH